MEKAGLPTDKAFALLKLSPTLHPRIEQTKALLRRGASIAKAGEKTQLFSALEASLLDAASNAGRLDAVYLRLSDYYQQRAAQSASIKAKLLLPGFLLMACFFIKPLPELVAGSITLPSYFLNALRPFALMVCAAGLVLAIRPHVSKTCPPWLDSFFRSAPIYGPMYIRANMRDFFETLALLLDAGVPILEAMPQALGVIQSPAIKKAFSSIGPAIKRGHTLSQAVGTNPYMQKSAARALIETGEASGTLSEMLFRWAAMETQTLGAFHKEVADWLPRLVYAAVAGWMALGFF